MQDHTSTKTRTLRRPSRGALALALVAAGALLVGRMEATRAASPQQTTGPTSVAHYAATAGWGNDDYAANVYTPETLNVYVGDTVTWHTGGILEPHTITFGPYGALSQLANHLTTATPQRGGPPLLELNPSIGLPTRSPVYDGVGIANSGLLTAGRTWSTTFTRPGTYKYHCLLHFPRMTGTVVVHQRPGMGSTYSVRAGYGSIRSAADTFFPQVLTIHAGSTVVWTSGFHTVAFGAPVMLQQLRRDFIVPMPEKNGPPKLVMNPRVAFPSGGTAYAGAGFWNSGLLVRGPARLTFTRPGVYHYTCLIHPGMDGTIRVIP